MQYQIPNAPCGFTLTSKLGEGSFAKVYKAHHPSHLSPSAIKVIQKTSRSRNYRQEFDITLRAKHQNVIELFGCYETQDQFFVVMEYCEMDLYEAITTISLPVEKCKEIFNQILDALGYCHSIGIYHRDVKPENILLSTRSEYTIRLADFGLATTDSHSFQFGIGSSRYMAPECYTQSLTGYSPEKIDVWSTGILLLNLLSQKNPWHRASQDDTMYNIYTTLDSDYLMSAFNLSPEFNLLVSSVLTPNPHNRITIQQFKTRFNLVRSIFKTCVQIPSVRSTSLPYQPASPVQSYLSYYSDTESEVDVQLYVPLTPQSINPCTDLLILDKSCDFTSPTLFQGIVGCNISPDDQVTI